MSEENKHDVEVPSAARAMEPIAWGRPLGDLKFMEQLVERSGAAAAAVRILALEVDRAAYHNAFEHMWEKITYLKANVNERDEKIAALQKEIQLLKNVASYAVARKESCDHDEPKVAAKPQKDKVKP